MNVTTIPTATDLPEYPEWVGSPIWRDHLENHGEDYSVTADRADCPGCQVRPMLQEIHAVWTRPGMDGTFTILYSLQDGYGETGFIPGQGYDWSGIRDSSPAAVRRMFDAIHA